jgi:hypothetical protein
MNYVVAVIHLLIIGVAVYYFGRRIKRLRKLFLPSFLLKIIAGICVGLIYKYYYSVGDTFAYFEQGTMIANIARSNFSDYLNFLVSSDGGVYGISNEVPRALFFSKMVSLFNLITFDNYWIISIYFSSISFLSAWILLTEFSRNIPENTIPASIAFMVFPSIVFWGSGIVKECISAAALYFIVTIFIKIWFDRKISWIEWVFALFAIWVQWTLKYYVVAVLFIVVGAALTYKFIIARHMTKASRVWEMVVFLAMLIVPFFTVLFLHPNFSSDNLLNVVVSNYETFIQLSAPGDAIIFHNLQPNIFSILLNSPIALFSGLFRPVLWEASNLLQLVIALENFVLIAATLFSIRYVSSIMSSPHRILIYMLIIYIIILCIFLTLSSPNFGTLARYRVSFLPFFVLLVLSSRPMINLMNRAFGSLAR